MNQKNLKISFVGDLMCLKEQNEAIRMLGFCQNRYDDIFRYVRPLFVDTDFLIGNLETPVCSSEFSDESISFNTPVEFVRACKSMGINFVSTANNHCLDRGSNGLIETIKNLDNEKILHTGTYLTKDSSEKISVIEINGIKIAIIAATFGTNSEVNGNILPADEIWRVDLLKKQNKPARVKFNPDSNSGHKMIADNVTSAAISNSANRIYLEKYFDKIRHAKEIADIIVVIPHIGGQYNPYPGTYTRHIIKETAKLDPSIIVAGHPHVPQYCAKIENVPTAFSLGNFTFTPDTGYYIPNSLAEYGIVLHSYWSKDTKALAKLTFSIVKNFVDENGISRVYPVSDLYLHMSSPIERERLYVEVQAVANRVTSSFVENPLNKEITLESLPTV